MFTCGKPNRKCDQVVSLDAELRVTVFQRLNRKREGEKEKYWNRTILPRPRRKDRFPKEVKRPQKISSKNRTSVALWRKLSLLEN